MAGYPTFEEYQKSGNYDDGLKRVDQLLAKAPKDSELLILKAQLLVAKHADPSPAIDELLSLKPPLQDLNQLVSIEQLFINIQHNDFPPPKSTGPKMAQLWDSALKSPSSSTNYKLDLLYLRFSQGIVNNRLQDAQQALIQLKALQPKNRVLYMAHAAVTHLLSTGKDDLQARLGLSLARKAVKERFDGDGGLDCRVSGQILAVSGGREDLEGVEGRRFGRSRQVHEAVRRREEGERNGVEEDGKTKGVSSGSETDVFEAEVAGMKERFAGLIESEAKIEDVTAFTSDALRLFQKATKSSVGGGRRLKVDACFLAVSGLIRAFEQADERGYLFNAAHMAETLLRQNEHVHEARLILVYLYMRLGLGSLAIQMFESLNVKEIQHDTVGHAVFTRLSLIHPYETGPTKKEMIAPLKKTGHALQVYTKCEDKLAETEASVLAHGQTGMIFDLQELRDTLRSSLTRRVTYLEQRRIDRLLYNDTGRSVADLGPQVVANWTQVTDNRDFTATFNYGYNVEKVLQTYNGSVPGEEWILYALVADAAWCLALGKPPPVIDLQLLLEKTVQTQSDIGHLPLNENAGFRPGMHGAELRAGNLACQVLKLLLNLNTEDANLPSEISAIPDAIAKLDIKALSDADFAFAEGMLDCYAYIDILRIADKAVSLAKTKATGHVDALAKLQKVVRDEFETFRPFAKGRMDKVREANVRAAMEKDGKVAEGVALFGEDGLETFCTAVAASAREGWEGVGRIKLA